MRMEEVINRKKLKAGGAKKKEAPVRVLDARDAMLSELRSKTKLVPPIRVGAVGKNRSPGKQPRSPKKKQASDGLTHLVPHSRACLADRLGRHRRRQGKNPSADVPLPPLPPHVETTRKVEEKVVALPPPPPPPPPVGHIFDIPSLRSESSRTSTSSDVAKVALP